MRGGFLSSSLRGCLTELARFSVLIPCILLASCGGGGGSGGGAPATTYTATSGVAQKGPLIKGSTVTAQQLSATLSPTGQEFTYQVTSDLGTFSPTSTFTSQYIGLNATGYYFDEAQNAISEGPVTLNGYSDLAVDTVLNVNLLTTLAYQRIQKLMTGSGMAFTAARTQAETEVLTALNIPPGNYGAFGTLDVGGNSDGDHILAAISTLFVYGNSAGQASELIANFQSDLGAHGVITSAATQNALIAAAKAVNPATIAANLTQEYASLGVTFTAADISDWISQNGDSVVGRYTFQVSDATPSSVFTFPSFVVSAVAGSSVSVSAGQLSLNGAQVSGPVAVSAGDVIAVTAGSGKASGGVLTCYLQSGSKPVARVSFVSDLQSIAVTPARPSITAGLTQQFTATGTFSDGSTVNLTASATWTSSAPSIATLNATGLATTLVVGSTTVTATSGSISGSAMLTVTSAALESISITPDPIVSGVGLSLQLTATGTYSDGTTAKITNSAQWTSSAPSVATVGQTTGLLRGAALGSTTITAALGSVNATAPVSVVTNTWVPTGSMFMPRSYHTATLLPDGTVLAAGGLSSNIIDATATTEIYSPLTGTWSSGTNMSAARAFHTATLLQTGQVLVVGGLAYNAAGQSPGGAELYDPIARTWGATGNPATPRTSHTATLLTNGKVLVVGGFNSTGPFPASVELYDPSAGTWSAAGSLVTGVCCHTATLLPKGSVLVAGGCPASNYSTAAAELYDPIAGTWSSTGSLVTPRCGHTATLLPNGLILVAGGTTGSGSSVPVSTAELYNPATGTWSSTGSLSTTRTGHTATLLRNGTVLVVGGESAGAEIYDPSTGTWSLAANIAALGGHAATALSNGVVLVTGGITASGSTAAAQLYW